MLKKIKFTNKLKISLLSFSLIATIINVSIVGSYFINKIAKYSSSKDQVIKILSKSIELNNSKSDFLNYSLSDSNFYITGNSQFIDKHRNALDSIKAILSLLKENSLTIDDHSSLKIDDIIKSYEDYNKIFEEIILSKQKEGFSNYGIIGELRNSIHSVDAILKEQNLLDKDIQISLLNLRKHEKDFMLRKDESSIIKFNEEYAVMLSLIESKLKEEQKSSVLDLLSKYKSNFEQVTSITSSIYGTASNSGLLTNMDETENKVEPILKEVLDNINVKTSTALLFFTTFFLLFALTGIIVAIIMAVLLVRNISKAFDKTKNIIHNIAQGNLNIDLSTFKNDEFGDIAAELNIMNNGLKSKSEFAANIGKGELNTDLTPVSDKDMLGFSLLDMQQSLQNAEKEEEDRKNEDDKRNWSTEGFTIFAEILRHNNDNIELLSFNVISKLVDYIGMNQGGLFIFNDNDQNHPHLEMTACYAFNRQKFTHKTIEIGEGLIGACYQEGETIYLTDIPDNYINITSGLGNSNPKCILIVPLKLNNKIFGIIELASFIKLKKHEIEFVEKIAESIASTISTVKVNIRTAQLLEVSQQQAEEMRAQEEEMRQNMEEMHATQEEMGRKETKMQEMVQQMTVQELELKQTLSDMVEKEKYTQNLIETMKQQEEELRQNMEEIHATQEELGKKDIIQQEEIARLKAENESILEKTLAKEFDYQKQIEDLKNKLNGNTNTTMLANDIILMEWSDEIFGVDIKLIDDQHKVLLKLINDLYAAFRKGQARDKMNEIINELVNYTSYHFGVEEKFFTEFKYQDTVAHVEQHIKFVNTINNFKDEFTGGKAAVSFEVLNFLKEWLINHIQITDRSYVSFFKENGIK